MVLVSVYYFSWVLNKMLRRDKTRYHKIHFFLLIWVVKILTLTNYYCHSSNILKKKICFEFNLFHIGIWMKIWFYSIDIIHQYFFPVSKGAIYLSKWNFFCNRFLSLVIQVSNFSHTSIFLYLMLPHVPTFLSIMFTNCATEYWMTGTPSSNTTRYKERACFING